jgi:RimJ/RimL family protein N-acetyltransferase
LLAVEKDSREIVGQIGLLKENIDGEEVWGIGYILTGAHYGKGYATEGAKDMADYAFHTLKAPKVICDIRPTNLPSIAVAEEQADGDVPCKKKYRCEVMPAFDF